MVTVVGGWSLFQLAQGNPRPLFTWLFWWLIALFWLAAVWWLTPRSSARTMAKLRLGQQRFIMDDQMIGAETAIGKHQLKWSAIRRVVETPNFLLFFVTDNDAHYLPKRAVPTAAALAEVRALIKRTVPS